MNDKIKEILNTEYKCLNHGFVRLVDVMGDDVAIVQAARTSYGQGTKSVSEDNSLIRYLLRNRHTSPFEMVEFKFHIKLPIFVARQWIRHRTANVNEYSGRYSEMRDEFYIPDSVNIRKQSTGNKQGRDEEMLDSEYTNSVIDKFSKFQDGAYSEYVEFINEGMAREIARINLPLSIFTEWYWKIDLHNLFHFLKLRLDKHAQYEIRVYAESIAEILKICVPLAFSAFEDFELNAINFSKPELKLLQSLILSSKTSLCQSDFINSGLGERELSEFLEKINKIEQL